LIAGAAACAHGPLSTATRIPPADRIPARAERAIDALLASFDREAAMGHVAFMAPMWRLAGNEGFDKSIDRIHARLLASGFSAPLAHVHEYPNAGHGWDHSTGTLAIVNADGGETVVLSKETHRVALCINSFSTPPGGRLLRSVDVGAGAAADFEGKDLKDAIVLGDASPAALWKQGMSLGAAGIVSTALPEYIVPTPPGAPVPPRDEWDILQWSSIPYDKEKQGFGFKASPRAAAQLRRALASGAAKARVTIASSFTARPARMIIAEIPGATLPDERVVIAAHVQEPGANDNASGSATLTEMAVALRRGIADGSLPAPARTITFLWLDEISGSRRWLADFQDEAAQVKWMFSLDMTGEDVAKTGGSFLVERSPDPGAIYSRAWDPNSEWGRSKFDPALLKGDLINDLHLAVCRRVGARTGWAVRSNPYEGGSDHTVFGSKGIPSVLDWHFTDRYYHTNFDTLDKVSAVEMRNVAAAVGATAWLMASATTEEADRVAELVAEAGRARLSRERAETASDRDAAVAAWEKWYAEAVASAARLSTSPRR
jgi:aminopeptidase YwaD